MTSDTASTLKSDCRCPEGKYDLHDAEGVHSPVLCFPNGLDDRPAMLDENADTIADIEECQQNGYRCVSCPECLNCSFTGYRGKPYIAEGFTYVSPKERIDDKNEVDLIPVQLPAGETAMVHPAYAGADTAFCDPDATPGECGNQMIASLFEKGTAIPNPMVAGHRPISGEISVYSLDGDVETNVNLVNYRDVFGCPYEDTCVGELQYRNLLQQTGPMRFANEPLDMKYEFENGTIEWPSCWPSVGTCGTWPSSYPLGVWEDVEVEVPADCRLRTDADCDAAFTRGQDEAESRESCTDTSGCEYFAEGEGTCEAEEAGRSADYCPTVDGDEGFDAADPEGSCTRQPGCRYLRPYTTTEKRQVCACTPAVDSLRTLADGRVESSRPYFSGPGRDPACVKNMTSADPEYELCPLAMDEGCTVGVCMPGEICYHDSPSSFVRTACPVQRCAFGYSGELCASCAEGYSRGKNGCNKCENVAEFATMYFGILLLLLAPLFYRKWRKKRGLTTGKTTTAGRYAQMVEVLGRLLPAIVGDIRVFIGVYQTLSEMGTTLRITFPPQVETFIAQIRKVVSLDIFSIPTFGCMLGGNYYVKLWVSIGTPVVIIIGIMTSYQNQLTALHLNHIKDPELDRIAKTHLRLYHHKRRDHKMKEREAWGHIGILKKKKDKQAQHGQSKTQAEEHHATAFDNHARSKEMKKRYKLLAQKGDLQQQTFGWIFFVIFLAYPVRVPLPD